MPDYEFRVARDAREREEALRLVYHCYRGTGLIVPNRQEIRVLPHYLLPSTQIFVAIQSGEVAGTMTLVGDGQLGLPMETIYGDEIRALRAGRGRLGEVSGLAMRCRAKDSLSVFVGMSQVLCPYAESLGIKHLLIAVHPRHARFYCRYLQFQPIGGQRACPYVCHRPAQALLLDFAHLQRNHRRVYDLLLGIPPSARALESVPMSPSERRQLLVAAEPIATALANVPAAAPSEPISFAPGLAPALA